MKAVSNTKTVRNRYPTETIIYADFANDLPLHANKPDQD